MTLEQRLLRLERANRRWRWLACLFAMTLIASVSIGQVLQHDGTLVVNRLIVKDDAGRNRIVLGAEEGNVFKYMVQLIDEEGRSRIALATFLDFAEIILRDQNERARITHRSSPVKTSTEYRAYDQNGNTEIVKTLP